MTTWSVLRLAMAAAIVAAVIAQLVQSVSNAVDAGRHVPTIITNFFSFFTILSNVSAAVVLVVAALWFLTRGRGRDAEPTGIAVALACVTTYMVITGLVYNTLLRGYDLEPGAVVPWSNEVLHLVGPLFLLADLFVGPLRRALPWRTVWAIVAFPIVWVVYTMIRAPFITNPGSGDPFWYPYPFLNPNFADLQPISGYPGVVLYVIGISVAIIAVGALVVWWGRRVGALMPDSGAAPTRPEAPLDAAGPTRREAPLDAPAACGGAVGTTPGGGAGTVETAGSPAAAPDA